MSAPRPRSRGRIDEMEAPRDDIENRCRVRPSPEAVARLWDSPGGWEAVMERWGWVGKWGLERMAVDGRKILRARTGTAIVRGHGRMTTPAQEAEAFDIAIREGVHRASQATGLGPTVLYRILRERGVTEATRISAEERSRVTREGLAKAKASRAATTSTAERTAA